MTQHTPITDMTREQKGDYLVAVEDLENSHTALLAAAKAWVAHMDDPDPEDMTFEEEDQLMQSLRAAIKAAEEVAQ